MNKIISATIDIILTMILILAIQTLSFSSLMFVLEYFGEDISIGVSLKVMCLAITSALAQLWVFFYFICNTNILKSRCKK